MGEVFLKLIDNNILCLPVLDGKNHLGLIDILDVLALLCSKVKSEKDGTPSCVVIS